MCVCVCVCVCDPGTYILSYNYTDEAGNVAQTVTRTVHVVDTTAPVTSLHGDSNITHEAGTVYLDANASWSDAVDGTGVILASGEVNASDPGTYVLSYNYTDGAGNVAQTVTRTVNVVDTTAPVISLYGDSNLTHGRAIPTSTSMPVGVMRWMVRASLPVGKSMRACQGSTYFGTTTRILRVMRPRK